ncbi:glycosyltransferase 87 family protein [Lysobacter antibioticus]|uniref:Dolichyl-phosphate-mannose-mannosyltransferase family protein n=1 Tax=Lysobacter antibioticus TaxID=84531 RepID=A0A0S2FG37_LYSAN|nr:glycosyltransferase 87 family protein [Lysobacter antibioticus]ALN82490.1 hypothetical protein LA76x_4381 [Lysobacter antibioticus]
MPAERVSWRPTALVALFFTLLAALVQRQDANWDLRNYHLYTPLAWLDGRLGYDIAAAQMQTWHNPIADLPFALLVRGGASGWLVMVWLALPSFIALLFGLRLLDALMPAQRSRLRTWMAGLVAITGAAVYPGTAATFNDHIVGAFVLAGLWWAVDSFRRRGAWATWLPVGLLAGIAAGLKLTAVMYCLGFIAMALCAGPLKQLPARLVALAIGGALGAALSWGPWGWYLWEHHGNPLFPYFNHWFHSPDALFSERRDLRFLPKTALDALNVPLRLLRKNNDFSEASLADARLLLGFGAFAVWLWLRGKRGAEAASVLPVAADASQQREAAASYWPLLAFVVVSYTFWLGVYSIYRYLYPLELLFSVLIVGVISVAFARRWSRTALVVGALLVIAPTKHPGWGRDPFRSPMISVEFPALPADSLVVTSTETPIGHAVAFLPRGVPALAIRNNFMDPQQCTRLQARVESRIAGHDGPLWLLRPVEVDTVAAERMTLYGLRVDGACRRVADSLAEIELCPLARTPFTPICSAPPGR